MDDNISTILINHMKVLFLKSNVITQQNDYDHAQHIYLLLLFLLNTAYKWLTC